MRKKVLLVLIIVAIILIGVLLFFIMNTNKYTKDEIKFYNEYRNVTKDNNVKYISKSKLNKILKSDSGIILLCNADNKKCHSTIKPLVNDIKEYNTTLYYYDSSKLANDDYNKLDVSKNDLPIIIFVKDGTVIKLMKQEDLKSISDEYFLEYIEEVVAGVCEKDSRC